MCIQTYTLLLLSVVALVSVSSCKKEVKTQACFDYTADKNYVYFDAGCSSNANEYIWNFGNGNVSQAKEPTVKYNSTGSYTVTLLITAADGEVSETVRLVNINSFKQFCFTCSACNDEFNNVRECYADSTYALSERYYYANIANDGCICTDVSED